MKFFGCSVTKLEGIVIFHCAVWTTKARTPPLPWVDAYWRAGSKTTFRKWHPYKSQTHLGFLEKTPRRVLWGQGDKIQTRKEENLLIWRKNVTEMSQDYLNEIFLISNVNNGIYWAFWEECNFLHDMSLVVRRWQTECVWATWTCLLVDSQQHWARLGGSGWL